MVENFHESFEMIVENILAHVVLRSSSTGAAGGAASLIIFIIFDFSYVILVLATVTALL